MAELRASGETFPISYWCGPPAEETTRERCAEIRDCGLTLALDLESHSLRAEQARRVRDYCAEIGLGAIVADARLDHERHAPGVAGSAATLDAVVAASAEHPYAG